MNNLSAIDLNLLVVLDALLAEQHVSRAALRLNKSQPAVSHALGRLRLLLDDPLLVRRGGKLVATPFARSLAPELAAILGQLQELLKTPGFDPATARRTFRLAMSDYGAALLLPGLIRVMRTEAPLCDLVISQAGREVMQSQVIEGEIDLALGVFPERRADICDQVLFREEFICVADKEHFHHRAGLSLERYVASAHILVSLHADSASANEIEVALGQLGVFRRNVMIVPHWSIAVDLVRGTDLILTVARSIVPAPDHLDGLFVFAPPFDIPSFAFRQIWHQRRDSDPAHLWLRQNVTRLLRD
ncbi:LysR substrate-binding domain-containing protein [Thalassospira sp. TSL5-1]|uniref:LysR substrate-binding domain-containing protein n=1 Tax=Thalassospira sp. TSL5-1 TaxID=1544451 RepID=UPI0009398D46|nr:LysR substrate-binding domain-containing protein [Thalassospira sp. TSL5-1]OKH89375.1 LysR family transcriptional regulator [Thalassospira sp. TSL5-1]